MATWLKLRRWLVLCTLSTLSVAGTIGLGIAIACAIDPKCFGSCPTFYTDSAGTEVLQAEGFLHAQ